MVTEKLDRRSKYSIKMIKSAFVQILKVKQLDQITVTEICEKADVNRGTFYKYFKDVYDLYYKTEDQIIERIVEMLDKSVPNNMEEFLVEFFSFVEKYYMSVSLNFTTRENGRFLLRVHDAVEPYIDKCLSTVLNNYSKTEKQEISSYIIGGIIAACASWINQKDRKPAKEFAKDIHILNQNIIKKVD